MLRVLGQLLEAQRPLGDELLVVELLLDQHLDHAEGQSTIRAGPRRDPLGVGGDRRLREARVDRHHPRAALPGSDDLAGADVGGRIRGRVGTPDHHHVRLLHVGIQRDVHLAKGHVRRDHGEGDVAERTDTEGVGRAEGEEHARSGGDGHVRRLEDVAKRELEAATTGVDGGRLRAVTPPRSV